MLPLWLVAAWLPLAGFALPPDDTDSAWLARTWQADDGLPNDTVTGLAQTSDGFLWITSATRLSRFDGVTFESYSTERLGLKTLDTINPLLRTRDDALWLGTGHGLVVQVKNGVPRVFTNNLPRHFQRTLTEDGDGSVWTTDVRGNICRIKDGVVTEFGPDQGWSPGNCSLTTDVHGRLWWAKGTQLGIFLEDRFQLVTRVNIGNITRIASARDGGLWICTATQLFRYTESDGLMPCGAFQTTTVTGPAAVMEARDGAVWIGTSCNGLFRYDGKNFESIPLSHHDIRVLLEDREGFIWAGMNGGGLNRISPRVGHMEGAAAGLAFETITTICEDSHSNVWATTKNGALACRTDGAWRTISTNADWPGGMAASVVADTNGNVWIGTKNQLLYRWHDGHFVDTLRPAEGMAAYGYLNTASLACRNGDLWISPFTTRALVRWHDGQLTRFPTTTLIGGIQALTEDADGNVWAGSSRGALLEISGDVFTNRTSEIRGTHAPIRCLYAISNTLWVAFGEGGIGRLKDGKFSRIGTAKGLPDGSISQIIDDGDGWLWFGSDHGIFKAREAELDSVADGLGRTIHPVHFGQNEGLKSMEATSGDAPNIWRGHDGRIWMPMRMGLVVIDPDKDRTDFEPPLPLLKEISVDDQVAAGYRGVLSSKTYPDFRTGGLTLRFPPSHRRLDFAFTALSFIAPESIHFRYRLNGFDDHWVDADTRRAASYSRLPAGDYVFEINACNPDGVWNKRTAVIAFTVTPFFWQTWWFRLSTVVLFTLGIVAAGRYLWFRRLRFRLRELEQKAALDKERARIAKDIHDDLGGSLTQTILLVKLAGKNPGEPEQTRQFLNQISAGVRQVVQSLDEIVWAANPGNDSLPHFIDYIGQFASEFLQAAGIRCRFDFPDDPPDLPLAPEIRHNLFLVLKESLNNIVRHAGASEVRLQVSMTDEQLQMSIRDNGKGFDDGPKGVSANGLTNMQHRMNDIGGRCAIGSKPGAGTTVTVSLPLAGAKMKT